MLRQTEQEFCEASSTPYPRPGVCPYSNATRGNVDVTLRVDGTPLGESELPHSVVPEIKEASK